MHAKAPSRGSRHNAVKKDFTPQSRERRLRACRIAQSSNAYNPNPVSSSAVPASFHGVRKGIVSRHISRPAFSVQTEAVAQRGRWISLNVNIGTRRYETPT